MSDYNKGERMEQTSQIRENTAPVYLVDLIIENIRCFRERQTLDLSDGNGRPAHWTILLGDNGTGKTTLLQCLMGLAPSSDYTFQTPNVEQMTIPASFYFDEYINLMVCDRGESKIGTSNYYLGFLNSYKPEKLNGFIVKCRENNMAIKSINSQPLFLPVKRIKNLTIYAYGASRRMGTGSLSEIRNFDNAASLFSDDVALINAEEWLLQADFAVKSADDENKAYFENRFDKVKELLTNLLPDAEDIRIKPITKAQKKPAIEIRTPYGWVGLKDLSLGYQTLTAWMVDLANRLFERYPEKENPLSEPAIVLVDEIDLHLHPKWQRTLIRHLTDIFRQTQFVVTAHSPLIVQSAQGANIVLLRREGDQVVILNDNDDDIIRGWRLDQVITSDLFDLPSARPAEYDDFLEERERILAKPQLSQEDKQRLEEVGRKLEELPLVTKNREDSEAMDISFFVL